MDKKSLLGLLIIGVILFGYTWYNTKQQEKFIRQQEIADSLDRVQHPEKYLSAIPVDSLEVRSATDAELSQKADSAAAYAARVNTFGQSLVDASQGQEQIYTLENDLLRLYVSSHGAKVANVELKDYKRYNGEPLMMFKEGSSVFDVCFFLRKNYNYAQVNTAEYYFVADSLAGGVLGTGEESKTLALRLPIDEGAYVEYRYTIHPDSYMIDFDIRFVGMEEWTSNLSDFTIDWRNTSLQNEKGFKNENMYTTVAYHYPGDSGIEQLGMSDGTKSEDVKTKTDWVAFKQQFFSSVLLAQDDFQNAVLKYETYEPGFGLIKNFDAKLSSAFYPDRQNYAFRFYFGPNKYSVLKEYREEELQRLVPLGGKLIRWVNLWLVIPVFDFLGKYISSYGLIILILTVLVKLLILPLTYKSYLSSAKMRVLKPEVDELNAKYPKPEDAMKKQQAMMELYKKCGVNPMGGCLPMLIQFPVLIALFRFFPASIELRGQSFLWAEDLSSYDSVLNLPFNIPWYGDHVSLFALLMAAAMFVYSKISYAQTAAAGPQMAGMKFMTLYLMPIMLLFWFNSYASGLCYYYLLSNLFTIGQMTGFRYLVNEEKLLAKLKSNAKKPVKKSKWQARYEELMRQQQQMQRQQQGKRR